MSFAAVAASYVRMSYECGKYTSWSCLELFNYGVANPLDLGVESQEIRGFLCRGF